MGNGSDDAIVRKVAPYPFGIQITKAEGQPFQKGQVVKMTELGFLMKVDGKQFYKVGDSYQVRFELPAIHQSVSAAVRVIKTYDAMEMIDGAQVKINTIEMHFKNLSDSNRKHIHSYLVKSGQKK